jgi:hypothetical protein
MYRILVTASRNWDDWDLVDFVLTSAAGPHLPDVTIVHGACPSGGDPMADRWALDHDLKPERHPADWHSYGRSAGPRRNAFMVARRADLCLAFIRNHSAGATGCADMAEASGIKTVRYRSGTVPPGPAGGDLCQIESALTRTASLSEMLTPSAWTANRYSSRAGRFRITVLCGVITGTGVFAEGNGHGPPALHVR